MNNWMWLIAAGTFIASVSQVLLKKSAEKTYGSLIKEYLNPFVIVGYGLMFVSTVCGVIAYHNGVEYKNGVMIESLGFVLVMVFSRIFFGEGITLRKIIGNILILAGMIIFYL
ncbi:MAG: multidrug ABC transporter [Lachnospiraceae bacterium]|nr:multidrug ABC transporter [Lachnospiraceae bacterium]